MAHEDRGEAGEDKGHPGGEDTVAHQRGEVELVNWWTREKQEETSPAWTEGRQASRLRRSSSSQRVASAISASQAGSRMTSGIGEVWGASAAVIAAAARTPTPCRPTAAASPHRSRAPARRRRGNSLERTSPLTKPKRAKEGSTAPRTTITALAPSQPSATAARARGRARHGAGSTQASTAEKKASQLSGHDGGLTA